MRIFGKAKEKNKLMLVFDLGSSSVGGALFWVQSSGVPKIIAAFREVITIEKDVDPSRFFASTMKSLDSIALKFLKLGLGAPKDIFCVLSSPWYVSQTRVIRFEKNTPFVFTSKVADDLIKKEMNLFEEEHMKQYLDAESPVRLIEVKNIKIMLNGYETPSPLNQKVKELIMTIFISMSPEQVLKKIEDTIGGHFSSEKIKFSSFMLSSFAVLRDMYIKNENFLLLEIGGEMTDIAMAKKNTLRESVSFPLGRNFIIRGVAEALKCSLAEARSTISLFQDGHAVDSVATKLEPILNQLKKEWLQKFQDSLANFSKDISIPATIYMIVEKDLAGLFTETIATEQFNQYTLTESKFQVIFLDVEIFRGKVEYAEDIIRDPGLVIDSIYINRFLSAKGGSASGGK